jgi:WD40 repeat protein
VVTCAHVVNTALGRQQRDQAPPDPSGRVQVEFPLLPDTVRRARVVAWAPPPGSGAGGGDVAGLELTEKAPDGTAPARLAAAEPEPGARLRVFGYPGSPARENGMWVDADLKGEVEGGLYQVESRSDQTVKAQPGYSGSPVWDHGTGEAVGLLHAAPFPDEPERDAYLLPSHAVAQAWEEAFDYLLVAENPYRGLEPFTAQHARVFFGRDADTDALIARMDTQPVVVVVGPSGVGKSSLVQAGLIHRLQERRQWSVALVRPGQDPWHRLASGLLRAEHGQDAVVTLEEVGREIARLRAEGFGSLARFLRGENRPLLVVVDQFEELLAGGQGPDPDLLDLLLPPPEAADAAVRLVVTLRADFQSVLQSIPGFHTRLNERLYLLSPLTVEQMREAVERPAAQEGRGVVFEQGLVDQILSDAAGGALPLLEFTLTKLWETQRRKTLTFTGYHQMGGVRGALNRFAEERAAQLTDTSEDVVNRVLLRLVRTPAGGTSPATRQRALRSGVSGAEWEVLRRLADARLVILDTSSADREAYAELAHESLITAWERLAGLVAENAEFLGWLAGVEQRAADGDALQDARIAEARRWLDTRPGDIPDAARTFIESSETAAEKRLRELRDARDRADTARQQAETAARHAEALRLAADAELALRAAHPPTTIALALGVESVLTEPTAQGDLALRRALRLHARTLVRLGHDGPVTAVAFSPDGTLLATASADGSARLFDPATGAELARLGHDGPVTAVAFSPDGTLLATASADGAARLFGAEVTRLSHDDAVVRVLFSPDGTRLATASADGSARLFDPATGAELARLGHDGPVTAVAFSPDGTLLATASEDQSARLFDPTTSAELARLGHHGGPVTAVAFSPDGTCLATASYDGSARVFDPTTGAELVRHDHGRQVFAVAFSPDATRLATAANDGSARVFDEATGAQLARHDHDAPVTVVAFSPDGTRLATGCGIYGHGASRVFDVGTGTELARLDLDGEVSAVAFSPDGAWVAAGSRDGSVRVLDPAAGGQAFRIDRDGQVTAAAFSPDKARLAVGSSDGSARVFDLDREVWLPRLGHGEMVIAVAFSPDGVRLATGSRDYAARVFDPDTGEELARWDHHYWVNVVMFSPDGTRLATSGDDGSARVFDPVAGAELARLRLGDAMIDALAFSPDGTRIAVAGADEFVRVFEATGAELAQLRHDGAMAAVAFSPDGTRLATGSHDNSARVFDLATGAELARVDHDGSVDTVVFSPDGAWVATGSGDGSARVFDLATGEQLARLDHDRGVAAVAFRSDGTHVATASYDGSARVFEPTPGLLVARAFSVMIRPLNPAELRRYSLPSDCRHIAQWDLRQQR